MPFQFNAKSVYLTYPQAELLSKAQVLFQAHQWGDVKSYFIAREQHEDGNHHIHAYLEYLDPVRTRSPNYFDCTVGSNVYHPNIQRPRNKFDVLRYLSKEDQDPLTNLESIEPVGR